MVLMKKMMILMKMHYQKKANWSWSSSRNSNNKNNRKKINSLNNIRSILIKIIIRGNQHNPNMKGSGR